MDINEIIFWLNIGSNVDKRLPRLRKNNFFKSNLKYIRERIAFNIVIQEKFEEALRIIQYNDFEKKDLVRNQIFYPIKEGLKNNGFPYTHRYTKELLQQIIY